MRDKLRSALVLLFAVFSMSCGFEFLSGPPPSPPPGFTRVDDAIVPDLFLRQPTFDATGKLMSVAGYLGPESGTVDHLLVLNTETQEVTFRTPEGVWSWLSLSPSGDQIAVQQSAYSTDPSPSGIIYVVDLKSNTPSNYTRGWSPTWSPDGQKLAFSYNTSRTHPLHLQIRIRDVMKRTESTVFDIQAEYGSIDDLAWSPDQKKLAFTMYTTNSINELGWADLYILDLTNDEWHKISDKFYVYSPTFSLDGEKVLYTARPAQVSPTKTMQSLYVVDLKGNCHHPAQPMPEADILRVILSPGGEKIAFETRQGVLVANTEEVLDEDFWMAGEPCTDS